MSKRLALIGSHAPSLINFRGPLIREVVDRGHEVFALAPDLDEESRAALSALGATPIDHRLRRTSMNPMQDAVGVADLVQKLRKIRPDVAFGYTIKPATFGILAAWMAGVPHRFAMIEGLGHAFIEHPSMKRQALRATVSLLYRASLARADRIFFLNPDDRADFLRLGLVTGEKTEVIDGIGVDLDQWTAAAAVTEPMTFLFIGRLLREKGILELVDAIRQVKAVRPEAQFVLLGDVDSNPSSLRREDVEAWVAEGLLTWPGQVDVAPWIARASVFVLPSYREGLPRSTQEAMAMARPVITTDVPGCRETVVEGKNGFLVPAKDATALAEAMLRFVERPELVERMGRESRRMAEERFDVKRANATIMSRLHL